MTTPTINRANRAKILDVMEHRACVENFTHRELGNNQIVLEGYAATYEPYDCYGGIERGGWIEQINSTAFDVTLATAPDVQLLINHEGCPLARTKSGTLQLSRDRHGLRVRAVLDGSDPDVQALLPKMKRGDMDEMSFGFRVKDQVWDPSYTHRTITEVSLQKGDVSVVNYGMNPTTHAVLSTGAVDALAQLSQSDLAELRSKMDGTTLAKALENLRSVTQRDTCPGGDMCPGANCPDHGADDEEEHAFEDGICVTCATARAKDPKKPYGDVKYADPKNGKYPIDTKAHVKAAWSYINMPKNQKGYTSSELAAIKGRIKAAAKKFGIEISEDKKSMTKQQAPNVYSVPAAANYADPRVEMVRDEAGIARLVAILPDGSRVPLPSQRADDAPNIIASGGAFKGPGYVYDPPRDLLSQDPQDSMPFTKTGGANEPPEGDEPNMTAPEGATLLNLRDDSGQGEDDQPNDQGKDDQDDDQDRQMPTLLAALESTIVHAYKLSVENDETTQTLLQDATKLIGRMHPNPHHGAESDIDRQLRALREDAGIPNISTVSEGLAYLQTQGLEARAG